MHLHTGFDELYNDPCQADGCEQEATAQWAKQAEDGKIYFELRCDDHPVYERSTEVRDLTEAQEDDREHELDLLVNWELGK